MRKAIHQGTCQICGATQKLPAGVLSLHGYTRKWGFFSGICSGAGHLPFEQSTELIEGVIRTTLSTIIATTALSDDLKAGVLTENGTAWQRVYDRKLWQYAWQLVTVTAVRHKSDDYAWTEFSWLSDGGEKGRIEMHEARGVETVDDMRKAMNLKYAKGVLDTRCAEMRRYIQWQRERVANWTPSDLKPVEE